MLLNLVIYNHKEQGTATKKGKVKNMKNVVRTFNLSGKFMYEEHFPTPEKAYEGYVDIIENMKRNLPKGFGVTVVRFDDEMVMSSDTVIGTI